MSTLIIGAGLAGSSVAVSLLAADPQATLTLIDPLAEPVELPPLSKSLFAAELSAVPLPVPEASVTAPGTVTGVSEAAGAPVPEVSVAEPGTLTRLQAEVAAVREGSVELADGRVLHAERIVIATGMQARQPAEALPGGPVFTIRSRADAEAIRARVQQGGREALSIGVLGSGYLALEAARGAADAGHRVTVYLRGAVPLHGRQHPGIAAALMDRHAAAGVQFVTEADPSDYAAHDLWIAAIGARPRTEMVPEDWRTERGEIRVDAGLQVRGTSAVWAVGDCARITTGPLAGPPAEAEAVAASQGQWLGARLARLGKHTPAGPGADAGTPDAGTAGAGTADPGADAGSTQWSDVIWHWSFQGAEKVFSVGRIDSSDPIVTGDPATGRCQVLHTSGAVLTGVETLNLPPAHAAARRLLALPPERRPDRASLEAGDADLRQWVRRSRS